MTALGQAQATYEAAKATLLAVFEDSRREFAGDAILDVAEEMTAFDNLDRAEKWAKAEHDRVKAEHDRAVMDALVATLTADVVVTRKVTP